MKRTVRRRAAAATGDELRREYRFDYRQSKPNRFAKRFAHGAVAVVLDPDVASVFNTSESVNSLLRSLVKVVRRGAVPRRTALPKRGGLTTRWSGRRP